MDEVEPYLKLIQAITNSDQDEREYGHVFAVYDMKDKERLVAIFSKTKYVAEFFGTTPKAIGLTICNKQLRNYRYKIERIDFEVEKVDD